MNSDVRGQRLTSVLNKHKRTNSHQSRNQNNDSNEPMQLPPAQGSMGGQANGMGSGHHQPPSPFVQLSSGHHQTQSAMPNGQLSSAMRSGDSSNGTYAPRRDPQAHLLFRTKMCKFYQMGACTRGPQCGFAHDDEVLRSTPDLKRTSLCPQLMKYGGCDKGVSCTYAHSKSELRPVETRKQNKKGNKELQPQQHKLPQSQMLGNRSSNGSGELTHASANSDGPSWRSEAPPATTRNGSGIMRVASMSTKDTPAKVSSPRISNELASVRSRSRCPTHPKELALHDAQAEIIPACPEDQLLSRRSEFMRNVLGIGADEADPNFVPNPLKAPFSSPRRVPQTAELFGTPNFNPTSPPWRPLSPSVGGLERGKRFGTGSIVVKNTFLEIVSPDGMKAGDSESPALRRVSTWGGNLSEADEAKGLDSFDSTTISSVASDEEDESRVKNPHHSQGRHSSQENNRCKGGGEISIVLSGFDDE